MLLSGSIIIQDLIGFVIALIAILIGCYKWSYQYWRKRNLRYLEPSIPYGNLTNQLGVKEHIGITMQKVYNEMKTRRWKHGGLYFFLSPKYFVVDLDYVKNVMTKDFNHFVDRGNYYNEKDDPLSAHLFHIGGPKWKNLRTKLTPTFTSGKMKTMFQNLIDCKNIMLQNMKTKHERGAPIDIKDVSGCFTTDVIGSCAFGLDLNTLEQENSPFREYGKKTFSGTKFSSLKRIFATTFPDLARAMGISLLSKDVTTFFMEVVKDTVNHREKNNYTRQDFMQLLIEMKNTLTMEEIAAQCFIFFLAGFETSSTTMAFAMYELAKHQDIQKKVRDEINAVLAKHGGKITYDSIQDLKYMNQVVDETLRKYPPLPFVTRVCVQDYKVPDENVTIEKGTSVIIPILGIHHDAEYYPDPEKFDPERFTEEKKNLRHSYAHIPFGEGPRICIGMRFGLMQTKLGLAALLKNYSFSVNKKTNEPLTMKIHSIVLAAEGEIWLDAHKL